MSSLSAAQAIPVPIANSELRELTSSLIGQKYLIKIRLPERYYETTDSYPLLVLLDGDHAFAMATDIVQYLIYGEHIPDLIIVSPAYGFKDDPEHGGTNMRNRDLLAFSTSWSDTPPGAADFLPFIAEELIPFVAANYRVEASNYALAGYSFGAFFALFALFQRPDLFSRVIAIDGMDERFLEMEEQFSADHSALPVTLSMLSGDDDMSV